MTIVGFQWARDHFEGLFRQPVETAQQYLSDPKFLDKNAKLPATQPVSLESHLFHSNTNIITEPESLIIYQGVFSDVVDFDDSGCKIMLQI